MLLRLTPTLRGNRSIIGIIIINDTGSDHLTLFYDNLFQLGGIPAGYRGLGGEIDILDASGVITKCWKLKVEIQLVTDDNIPWSGWVEEQVIIRPPNPGVLRLSGVGMRRALFFGTAPGNHFLAVSTSRNGLTTLL